jgi:hypothetical protein
MRMPETTTETTEAPPIPMVIPVPEYTPLVVPSVCLNGADTLMIYVQSKNGGVIDMLKFRRSGNSFVLTITGGEP